MDVNDLKGLFAEVKQADERRASTTCGTSSPACAPAARRSTMLDSVHVEAYGSKMPLNQVAGLSIPEPTLIVAQPFDPSLLGAIEKAIRAAGPRPEPGQRRQGGAHPDAGAHRGAPQGAVAHVHKLSRGGPQQRPPGAPRRQRAAEEAAQGPRDLRGRREEGARRGPEDHRPAHQARSTICRRRRTRSCSAEVDCRCSLLHPSRMLRAVRRAGRSIRASAIISASCGAAAARALRSRRGARLVARQPRRPRAEHVALPRAAAALRRRRRRSRSAKGSRRCSTRARSARRSASIGCTSRTNRSTRPTRSRRAASRRRSRARKYLGATTIVAADGRQRRQRRWRPTPPRAGLACRGVHPEGREAAVRRRMPAVRRRRHAGRRPDHRRRPHRRRDRAGRSAGTTSRR